MEKEFDLIVVGGGVAGVSAALSASREGLKVALIEEKALLGGLATTGLINWFEPICDGKGNQMIFSQCEEFFNLAIKPGYTTFDQEWKEKGKRKSTWFNHNLFALSLNQLMLDNKISVFYETKVSDVEFFNKRLASVEIITVEGKDKLHASQFIDASGNAILFRRAGVPVRHGVNYLTYATTTYKNGLASPTFQFSGSNLAGIGHPKDMKTFDGLNQDDVNMFLSEGMKLCYKEYDEGYIKDVSSLPAMPQFRKIASIEGESCLTKKDLFVHHEDSIGAIGVFNRVGETYEIPFGCLYSNKVDNLFAAGRIISSDDEGWEAVRVIPVGILTGEVAGLAAALKIKHELDIKNLQTLLEKRGIKLHF